MIADIIDLRTRKKWSPERIARASGVIGASPSADCTAQFYDLIFADLEDEDRGGDVLQTPRRPH